MTSADQPAAPGSPPATNHLGVFVGRQREFAELVAVLDDALGGLFSCALLVGEAGIGKTRVAREFAGQTANRGVTVMMGSCVEGHETPAYGPWREALAHLARSAPRAILPLLTGSGGQEVAALVPELRECLPEDNGSERLGGTAGRAELLATMTRFLTELAGPKGLVVVLDNAQWADPDSLTLLEHLAQEAPSSRIVILATARDSELALDHRLTRTLGELVKLPTFRRIHLAGLSGLEVRRYVEHALDAPRAAAVADSIHADSEGNPLFMVELVRDMLARDGKGRAPGVPAGIRDVIGRRLTGLPGSCVHVLSTAAVIGRHFDASLLTRLLDAGNADQVPESLGRAKLFGFVEELEDRMWQFAHVLFQETLYEDLPVATRMDLHARIAELMECDPGSAGPGWRGELLRHLIAGLGNSPVTATGAERLVRLSLLGAQEALTDCAPERAVRVLDRTLELVDTTDGGPARSCDLGALWHLHGRALHECGHAEGRPSLIRAFGFYTAAGDTEHALEVALTRSHVRSRSADLDVAIQAGPVAELRERALTMVEPDSLDEGRLLSEAPDRESLERALRIARRERDGTLETWSLARLAHLCTHQGEFTESLALWRQVLERARGEEDREVTHHVLLWYGEPLAILGDLESARLVADRMVQNGQSARSRRMLWLSHYVLAALAGMAGNWAACREHTDQVLSLVPANTPAFSRSVGLINLGLLEFEIGDPEAGYRCLHPIAQGTMDWENLDFPCAWVKIARITGDAGRLEELGHVLRPVPAPGTRMPFGWWETARRVARASVAVLLGDRETAASEKGYFAGRTGCYSPLGMAGRSYDAVLGLLESVEGEFDAAVGHLQDGIAFCRGSGLRPELAWTCLDLAQVLLQRDGPGDRASASRVLEEGRSLARCLNMKPLLEQIDDCAKRATESPEWRATLSRREGEVLRLVARGYTNREIGDRLFISDRTVATHMRNIFAKLGASNRAEATAWAVRNGIEED